MKSGIYKITNKMNGKFYIGSSKDIDNRWNDHKKHLNGDYHCNPKLQHSWNFHGKDNFDFSVIEEVVDSNKLYDREQFYLDTFRPYMRDIGYNICPNATGGDNITHSPNRDEFIQKMSTISSGENNPMFGKKHSEDTINKQKEKAKGRFSLEWFINKYGEDEGKKKYDDRRTMLKNRKINYSYDNKMRGKPGRKISKAERTKIEFLLGNFANRDFSVVVLLAACFDVLGLFLWIVAIGIWFFVVTMGWGLRRVILPRA